MDSFSGMTLGEKCIFCGKVVHLGEKTYSPNDYHHSWCVCYDEDYYLRPKQCNDDDIEVCTTSESD